MPPRVRPFKTEDFATALKGNRTPPRLPVPLPSPPLRRASAVLTDLVLATVDADGDPIAIPLHDRFGKRKADWIEFYLYVGECMAGAAVRR